jgi:PRTRC genetic system ThiF family protein
MKKKDITGGMPKATVHFTAPYLLNPTNPVSVHVIGAGGTGSRMITALAEINSALVALGHPGLSVQLFDDDRVSAANIVRQRFAQSELGMYKAVARINNINRWYGTNWKAVPLAYSSENMGRISQPSANMFISCVDRVDARFDMAGTLKTLYKAYTADRDKPFYWLDLGNGSSFGQAVLSTIGEIPQPASEKYIPVASLPAVTDEFGELLQSAESENDLPSCSAAEALKKQDLFINTALTQMSASLLWDLFRSGMTENRGLFLNLKSLHCVPLKVAV